MRAAHWHAWRSRVGSAGFLTGLMFVAMAARGDGCTPEPDPGNQTECTKPADCDGLAATAECTGAWTCENNTCAWQCDNKPVGCYSDSECPDGFECNSGTVCLPPPGCAQGADCPAVCYGECVKKVEPPPTCTSSDQCPNGTHCSTDDGVCNSGCGHMASSDSNSGAPRSDMACPAVCTGECVANPTNCFQDSECGQGQFCDRSTCGGLVPTPDAAGARVACPGQCRDRDHCTSDDQCGAGESCSCVFPTTAAPGGIMACDLRCVPTTPPECQSNDQCPSGTQCISDCAAVPADASAGAADRAFYCPSHCVPVKACGDQGLVCGPNENCSVDCAAKQMPCDCIGDQPCDCPYQEVCEAKCVPQPSGCSTDADCGSGFYCGCGPFNSATPGGMMMCNLQCLPKPQVQCASDSECGADSYCDLSQCIYNTDAKRPCDANDPSCGQPAPPACLGVCAPRAAMCSTNADCGSGYECVIEVCAGAADPNGNFAGPSCWGHCQVAQPKPYDCWSDSDCGAGGWCEYDYQNCTADFVPSGSGEMPMPACGGWCHQADPLPCDPNGDMVCPPGTACQPAPGGCGGMTPVPASGVPCMPTYQCLPVVEPECKADCDCAFGFACQAGSCVVQEAAGPCDANWTCKEGYTCGCPTRFGGPAAGVACFPQCYPDRPECCDDSQCGGGEICNGGACETVFCYDQKCPEGHHCESQCGTPSAGAIIACPMVCVADAPACTSDCDCDASTACIAGSCQAADRMNQCYYGQCATDADCGPGSYCKVDYYAGCEKPDMPCAMPRPVGYCVAQPTPIPCGPDQVCPQGTVCTATQTPNCPSCDIAYMQCVPIDGCQADADCGPGGVCHNEGQTCACYVDASGKSICPPCAPPKSWCEYPPPVTTCGTDSDCPSGFSCTNGVCGPTVDLGCKSDGDCATGERCDFKACAAAGACAPGTDCSICTGQCVPQADTNPCFATGCSGQICAAQAVVSTCEFLPWYACYKLATCEQDAAGSCGWQETPEFVKCMQDLGGFSSAGSAPR